MYYVITRNKVIQAKNLKTLENKHKLKFESSQFISCGADNVVNLSEKDIDFVQDAHILNNIPIKKLFKADNSSKLILYIMLGIQVILLIKK